MTIPFEDLHWNNTIDGDGLPIAFAVYNIGTDQYRFSIFAGLKADDNFTQNILHVYKNGKQVAPYLKSDLTADWDTLAIGSISELKIVAYNTLVENILPETS